MFDRSVSATAGWPSLATRLIRSEMRTMPSETENSEWTRKCTNGGGFVTASDMSGIVPSRGSRRHDFAPLPGPLGSRLCNNT
ncbi:Uncharacterised protein [Bordetella pertussis]|nr:Uncharacterised protein [Bordetella pertussis]CFO67180.1 Uncharacterised protein [Bordetella pertussis]CFU80917.1 Uncharacterised protein [Bordetella pertussis]CFV95310.1 Uncharacterised protein [Bordetella pertussis]CFW32873.1 Uncharacterised protein [Bordetella pertussis]